MSEWISVKDRLPEKEKRVLIYIPNAMLDKIMVACFCNWNTCDDWHPIPQDRSGYDNLKLSEVSHWMPLPKLPTDILI